MFADAIVAYAHYLSIILTGMLLAYEIFLFRAGLSAADARRLMRVDQLYPIAALSILGSGLLRVFAVGKGSEFYLDNPVFYFKLGVYLMIALLSIPPTLYFLRWRAALKEGKTPTVPERELRRVRRYLHAEMTLFLLMPLLAALLARGIGR